MLIGLCGYIGAGKTTVANLLVEEHEFDALAFADKLKTVVDDVFCLNEWEMRNDQTWKTTPHPKLGGHTPREVYQQLGTEGFRSINPDVWLNYLKQKLADDYEADYTDIVVTDVRFVNEAKAIIEMDGIIVVVRREGIAQSSEHASEAGLIEIIKHCPVQILENNGTLDELGLEVASLVRGLRGE
jgi:hypothetical protein